MHIRRLYMLTRVGILQVGRYMCVNDRDCPAKHVHFYKINPFIAMMTLENDQ